MLYVPVLAGLLFLHLISSSLFVLASQPKQSIPSSALLSSWAPEKTTPMRTRK